MGNLSLCIGVLIHYFLNFIDGILQSLGIKICDINPDYIIKGKYKR